MKKILLILLSVFLVGCTLSVKEEESYLSEKQECFEYRDFAREELVSTYTIELFSFLETVFYSPVLDTCVAVVNNSYSFEDESRTEVVYWDILRVTVLETFTVSYFGENEAYLDIASEDYERLREYRAEIGVPFN